MNDVILTDSADLVRSALEADENVDQVNVLDQGKLDVYTTAGVRLIVTVELF
jgi:hypothetical protein